MSMYKEVTCVSILHLLFVMLLMPLHGSVVTEHHFPQCFAQVSQAGDVAVRSDVLVGEREKKQP